MHSSEDELLSLRQTRKALDYVSELFREEEPYIAQWSRPWVSEVAGPVKPFIMEDADLLLHLPAMLAAFQGGHDAMLTNQDFLECLTTDIEDLHLKPRRGREEAEAEADASEGE